MFRSLFVALLILSPLAGNAAIQGQTVSSLTGLNFSVSGAGSVGFPSSCNALYLDTNGSLAGSGRFSAYGVLGCPATNQSFGVTSGSGYITTAGTLALYLNVGTELWNCTLSTKTLDGNCNVFSYSNMQLGVVTLTLQP